MSDPSHALKEQLATLHQTAHYLLEHATAHGGKFHLPPETRHHALNAVHIGIAQCKAEQRVFGVVVDD